MYRNGVTEILPIGPRMRDDNGTNNGRWTEINRMSLLKSESKCACLRVRVRGVRERERETRYVCNK